jgi:hypothetical protein
MKIKVMDFNPYVNGYSILNTGEETDGKKIFELTEEEYAHFVKNIKFYKVKSKKLYFDEAYQKKTETDKKKIQSQKDILNLKTELIALNEQIEKCKKYNMNPDEFENKVLEIEDKIKESGGETYIIIVPGEGEKDGK